MKKKNNIIIAIVAVVGIAALIVATLGGRKSTFDQDYHIKDINTISKIFIATKQNTTVLLERNFDKEGDSAWTVDGQYTASQPLIDLLLETLNTMRIRQEVNKTAVPNIIKQISAKGIKCEIYQKKYFIDWFNGKIQLFPHEKHTTTYFVGQETQDNMGTFMYREGDKVPVVVHIPGFRGFIAPRFVADPLKWRSHRIASLDVHDIARIELDIPSMPEESFAIFQEGEGFGMELTQSGSRVGTFDTARVAQFLSSFTNLNFDEFAQVVPKADLDSSFNNGPRTILKIQGTNGFTKELKTYIKYSNPDDLEAMPDPEMYNVFDLNRLYAIIDDKDTVLIQYYVFDNILQPASFFLGQNKSFFAR